MAALTVQTIARTGTGPTYAAATSGGGDTFVNNGKVFLHVKNGGGSPINVTIASKRSPGEGLAKADQVVAVPNAGERMIGPFDPNAWNDATTQAVTVTYSAVTSVTVAAIQLPTTV